MRTGEKAALQPDSSADRLNGVVLSQLASLLPDYIASRRWFRAKTRTIQSVEIEDALPTSHASSCLLVTRLKYTEGEPDIYLVDAIVAEGIFSDIHPALSERPFRDALLTAITCNRSFQGTAGELSAARTIALPQDCGRPDFTLDSSVGKAEQSNTSILYGDRFILKLFRKLEPGTNPDIEIGTFLTERGFEHTPPVLGKIEYTRGSDGATYAVAILQQFVRNQGDAWKYTLDSLSGFFRRALATNEYAPKLASYHPADGAANSRPESRKLIGEYVDSARLLGQRTAEMHAALADPQGGDDFAPEAFTLADGRKLHEEMLGQADIAFELLRRKQPALTGTATENARMLLRGEHRVTELFSPLRDQPITAARIRVHGDYHLGQVLYTGTDFMIIDFEGEPARALSERRGKTLAMRDVAGMIRSFQYAAYAALFGQVEGIPQDPEMSDRIESWAAFWAASIGAEYLNGYFSNAEGLPFLPRDSRERRVLLDAYLLQKALYEVAYELNNRPDWVRIPLRGILSLIS